MGIIKTLALNKYYHLSCYKYQRIRGNKKYEESLVLSVSNDGGKICFTFTNLLTNEVITFDNPKTGDYIIPMQKGDKFILLITATKANGSYKISKIKKTL